jgi:AraC-like DNA-binding protein
VRGDNQHGCACACHSVRTRRSARARPFRPYLGRGESRCGGAIPEPHKISRSRRQEKISFHEHKGELYFGNERKAMGTPRSMPSSTILKFSDPYEYQAAFGHATDLNTIVTARGSYQSKLTLVNLHRLELQHARNSLPKIVRGTTKKNVCAISFLVADNKAYVTFNGAEVSQSCISFYSPATEYNVAASAECYWAGITVAPETLALALQALVGYEITAPKATQLIRTPAPQIARLLKLHEAAVQLATTAPDVLSHPEVARVIEQELLRALIACLGDPAPIKKANPNRQRVLQRFHQVVDANQYEPLYLPEICSAVGVSERTLHSVCTSYLGVSPHRYLWLRRMNLVRRALALADPKAKTVTTVANDYGFAELGRFAVAYRVLYGESPSATLRRASD